MKKIIMVLPLLATLFDTAMAQGIQLKTGTDNVMVMLDGKRMSGDWRVAPEINPDILETTAGEIAFISDKDTLVFKLGEWESKSFDILTQHGDTSHVLVKRSAVNPFENPNPELLKVAASGMLTREQAKFDIDALLYALSQIHIDIFSVCSQEDFFRAVNRAVESLPDSVSHVELYRRLAPIVAMIGDGHTNLGFPFNSVFTKETKRLPVFFEVLADRSLVCTACIDSVIPEGARILGINGMKTDEMLDSMMPFVSGERPHFKLSRINYVFTALFQMLYAADSYNVEYLPDGMKKPLFYTFPAVAYEEMGKRLPRTKASKKQPAYSFSIDSINNVAVMDFRSFSSPDRMRHFADSMFTALRSRGIGNLIIDLRNNGGGNSIVGDILLRYISPKPFVQMDKVIIKITPLTMKLQGSGSGMKPFGFFEIKEDEYIKPLTEKEGHYCGKVYILTSNHTFSSAADFSWAFKECGVGTVIGEETGGMNVCYGDILNYRLPVSKLSCSVSYKRFWGVHADEKDIHGTIPDVAVKAADAMEAAMKLVKKNKRRCNISR